MSGGEFATGGAGTLGFAHVGALKAMSDLEVPIDVIGGTNQGAIMGALYAMTLSGVECQRQARLLAKSLGSTTNVWDVTVPILSRFNGYRFSRVIRDLLRPNTHIEDLWISYFCVCTNITKVGAEVCTRGSLWQAVRASMTVVGLVPPMYSPRGLLVDGGYANNLPADYMRQRVGNGLVIACDVEHTNNAVFRTVAPYPDGSISGLSLLPWQIAMWALFPYHVMTGQSSDRLVRFVQRMFRIMPSHNQLMEQLLVLTHQIQLRKSVAATIDFLIKPHSDHTGSLNSSKFEQIVTAGYQEAHDTLRRAREQAVVTMHNLSETPAATRPPLHRPSVSILSDLIDDVPRGSSRWEMHGMGEALLALREQQRLETSIHALGSTDLISRVRDSVPGQLM
eukprot:c18908_g1_i1.p1 GENE.c18908_g1_i1~~c18908_g1_i1.p1  ORF type:complete len:394 (+),score=73.38 c18908_g1_i1:143-1324(+)